MSCLFIFKTFLYFIISSFMFIVHFVRGAFCHLFNKRILHCSSEVTCCRFSVCEVMWCWFSDVMLCRFSGSEVRQRDDEMPHAHIAVAVEGAGWANADNIPLMITNTLIGTWDRTIGGGSGMAGQLAVECSRDALCNSFQVCVWWVSQPQQLCVH